MRKNFNIILSAFLILTILFSNFSVVFSVSFIRFPSMVTQKPITQNEDTFNTAFDTYKKTVGMKFLASKVAPLIPEETRSFLQKFLGISLSTEPYGTKEMLADYIDIFWMPYIGGATKDAPEMLATVITNITEKDWSSDAIKDALWRGIQAFVATTSGIPTQDDLDSLITELTNQQYYYPDLPIPEDNPVYTYTTIQDVGRMCNFSSMYYNYPETIYYFTDNNGKTWSYKTEEEAKAGKNEKKVPNATIKTIDNPNQKGDPICIIKDVEFYKENSDGSTTKETAYLVALAGTSFTSGQSSGLIADILSGCESNSPYLQKALEAISTIPKKTNGKKTKIVIAGFSLGGMIAQQVMVQPVVYNNYDIRQVVLLGCPSLCVEASKRDPIKRLLNNDKNRINRVIDQYDFIPYCSTDYLRNENSNVEIFETLYIANKNNSAYKTFFGTHFVGYMKSETYEKYDVFGFPQNHEEYGWKMKINYKNAKNYAAPNRFLPGDLSAIE